MAGYAWPEQQQSDFAIEEAMISDPSRIVLTGRATPHRPVRWGGEAEYGAAHFAGNNLTTFQALYPRETPTEFKGRWKSEYIDGERGEIMLQGAVREFIDDPLVLVGLSSEMRINPDSALLNLCEKMDALRATVTIIDVTWMGRTRRGMLKSFHYDVSDTNDISWQMTVDWESYKVGVGKSKLSTDTFIGVYERDWADRLSDYANFLDRALGFDPIGGVVGGYQIPIVSDVFAFMAKVQMQLGRVHEAVNSLRKINETLARGVRTPFEIARNVLQQLLEIRASFDDILLTWESNAVSEMAAWASIVDGYQTQFSGGVGNANLTSFGLIRSEYEIRQTTIDNLYALNKEITRLETISNPLAVSNIRDVVVGEEGQHIGQLSTRFYGSFGKWPQLARFNNISYPILEAGQIVLIPKKLG